MSTLASDLDLEAIRSETGALAAMSYRNDGLDRSDVLWRIQTIAELLTVVEDLRPEPPV